MPEREQKLIRAHQNGAPRVSGRDYADEAFDVLLLFYGISNSGERKRMVQIGEVHRLVKVLQEYGLAKVCRTLAGL